MSLSEAIRAFNAAKAQEIELRPKRDGRVNAFLPLIGREVMVEDSRFKPEAKVGPLDVALICQEARRSMAPALALLDAALAILDKQPTA